MKCSVCGKPECLTGWIEELTCSNCETRIQIVQCKDCFFKILMRMNIFMTNVIKKEMEEFKKMPKLEE